MAASVQQVPIGPFTGGLNTFSDPTAVPDNALVECLNMDLDLDGSLISRPPIVDRGINFPLDTAGNINVLGYYYGVGGSPYLIASDGNTKTYYFDGTTWNLITDTFSAAAMVQFDGQAWMTAPIGSANPGGYWTPAGGFVAQPNMPKGSVIQSFKSRLWVAGGEDALTEGTFLRFSKVLGQSDFWPATPDFINIGVGDGQNIVSVMVYYESLLIFRTNSIYRFAYSSDPAAGDISLTVPGIGLATRHAVVPYENYVYFMYEDSAYEFLNGRANEINVSVPFSATNEANVYLPKAVSVFNDRVIFSYYDTMYVFSLRTRTWSRWRSTVHGGIGRFYENLAASDSAPTAICFSNKFVPAGGTRVADTLHITDAITLEKEDFECVAQTKNFNYDAPSVYKRLMWWGVDAVFKTRVDALAYPISFSQTVTWGQLLSTTWGSVKNYGWSQPFTPSIAVETVRDTSGSGSLRKFVKFDKSLRFRQIYFRVSFETDGSIDSAPVRLFNLMTYVRAGQRVSKTVT